MIFLFSQVWCIDLEWEITVAGTQILKSVYDQHILSL